MLLVDRQTDQQSNSAQNIIPLSNIIQAHTYQQENHTFIVNFDIFIYMYSIRGETDQLSANAFKYRVLCAAVYIL